VEVNKMELGLDLTFHGCEVKATMLEGTEGAEIVRLIVYTR
jgi:hypothetical protein